MKSFASTSFFRVFNGVVRESDAASAARVWSKDGVDWARERHSYRGPTYQFSIDVYVGTRDGKKGWSVLVVREAWWTCDHPDPRRHTQSAHLISGSRADALAWFRRQDPET